MFHFQTPTSWYPLQVALAALLIVTLSHTNSQLVLDDVAEDDELVQQHVPQEATDPMTRLLQWGVDNTGASSV